MTTTELIELGFDRCDNWPGWHRAIDENRWLRWHDGQTYVGDARQLDPNLDEPNDQIIGNARTADELRAILARFN